MSTIQKSSRLLSYVFHLNFRSPLRSTKNYYFSSSFAVDLVTLDDLSAAAMLESSARIETLANAWDQMNSEPPLAAPPAALPYFVRRAGFCSQLSALFKRFIIYKQPGSLLSWISKLIVAAILSLLIGCIYWDVPTSDPQLKLNDRFGYHHCIMIVAVFPLLLMTIRDTHLDRKFAEKDISLRFYGRTVYIITQVGWTLETQKSFNSIQMPFSYLQPLLGILPNLIIWLAYLLPAHCMSALYSYTNDSDTGILEYIGKCRSNSRSIISLLTLISLSISLSHRLHVLILDPFANADTILYTFADDTNSGQYILVAADVGDHGSRWLCHPHRRYPMVFVVEREHIAAKVAHANRDGRWI